MFSMNAALAGAKVLNVNPQRTIQLTGPVDASYEAKADKLLEMSETSGQDIFLVINSSGGQVYYGETFISAMHLAQKRGIKINCFVPRKAYSMAMYIYGECDRRYALKGSDFMWHSVRIAELHNVDVEDAADILDSIKEDNERLTKRLLKKMKMKKGLFFKHFKKEDFLDSKRLLKESPGFLTIVDDMRGVRIRFTKPAQNPLKSIMDLFK